MEAPGIVFSVATEPFVPFWKEFQHLLKGDSKDETNRREYRF